MTDQLDTRAGVHPAPPRPRLTHRLSPYMGGSTMHQSMTARGDREMTISQDKSWCDTRWNVTMDLTDDIRRDHYRRAEIDTPNGTHEEIGAAVVYTAHEGQALEAAE